MQVKHAEQNGQKGQDGELWWVFLSSNYFNINETRNILHDDAISKCFFANINVIMSFSSCFLLNMCVYSICLIIQATVFLTSISVQLHADVYNGPRSMKCLLAPLGSHMVLWRSRSCVLFPYGGLTACKWVCLYVRVRGCLKSSSLED